MTARSGDSWSAERCARLLAKPQRTPTGWKACCPAHEDRNPSLFLADGKDGGLALVCYAGCTYQSIAQALESKGAELGRGSSDRYQIPSEHFSLGPYSSFWDYRDARGFVVMRVCRWEQPGGKKDIRPIVRTVEGWKWQHHPTPRPMFQLDRLANEPEAPVIVTEGEKAALAAQRLFPTHVATTWPGGAQSVGQADWTPMQGRHVVLWPDNDGPGRKAMAWVAQHLKGVAASCRTVSIETHAATAQLPEGWDLADALAEAREVSSWLAPAEPEKREVRIRRLSDILASPTRPRWLLRDILEASVIGLLTGPRGTFKSFIALHWAMCIAIEGSPVVVVSAEGSGIDRRFRAWLQTHQPHHDPENLPVYALERRIDFNTAEGTAELIADIEALAIRPVLIVIDTLSKNSGAMDENSNTEVKAFIGRLDLELRRRYDATVLLVHHTGHVEQKRARGASALEADTDAAYVITRQPRSQVVTVSRERFKDSPDLPELTYQAEVVCLGDVDEDGQPVTSVALKAASVEAAKGESRGREPRGTQQKQLLRVLRRLQEESPQGPDGEPQVLTWTPKDLRDIARQSGMSKQTAQDAAAALASFYLVATVGGYRLRKRDES
jgi:hypothetical protein